MHESLTSCPGCQSEELSPAAIWKDQPTVLNYVYHTASSAEGVARRDMTLRQCTKCALIFNASLDASLTPYDEGYDNRQSTSPTFLAMMKDSAQNLTDRYSLHRSRIVEVGCGKGDFLRLICGLSDSSGIGFDTSCEPNDQSSESLTFIRRYASPADITRPVDAILCRHVVEHVSAIGPFMQLLANMAQAGDSRVVYIETPSWEWIVSQGAFWDIFYEHCNYFSLPTLRYLAELAGMEVMNQGVTFGGQYQTLELQCAANRHAPLTPPGVAEDLVLSAFATSVEKHRAQMKAMLVSSGADRGWAIWGAGAKGVALANTFRDLPPSLVVDTNERKQGAFVPGTSIPIIGPRDSRLTDISVVLVANSNYVAEIRATLEQLGLAPLVLTA